MDKIVPLISSGTEGPLGLKHLPRLWLKTLLSAHGRLLSGYKDVQPGFDFMCLEGIGIDPEAARDYLFREKPSYLRFEAWVKAQPGADLSPETIARVNKAITQRQKTDESRRKVLEESGLPDDGNITDGVMINNLDDWRAFYLSLQE